MAKQITYVIENDEGKLFAGVTTDHIWWTGLISKAILYDNKHLANKANREAKGIVKRMKYTLEEPE